MKLKSSLSVHGDRIDFEYDTAADEYSAVFAMSGTRHTASTPGAIYNALAPYRGNREVDELCQWLFR